MRKIKPKFTRYTILIALILSSSTFGYGLAEADQIPAEQQLIVKNTYSESVPSQGELFDDLDSWSFIPSQIQPPSNQLNGNVSTVCDSIEDSKCAKFLALNIKAFLPVCTSTVTQYCIEEFFALKDGKRIVGLFKDYYPNQKVFGQFNAEPAYKVPEGRAGSLWQLPGLSHAGGDLYWINSQLLGSVQRDNLNSKFGAMTPNQVWSSVSAVSEVSLIGSLPPEASPEGGTRVNSRPTTSDNKQCLMAGKDACVLAWPLDQNISYGMKIRMAAPINGWLHGRLNSPEFTTSTTSDGLFHLTMLGKPVKVPTVYASTEWSKASDAIKARFGNKPSGCCSWSSNNWYDSAGRNQSSEEMVSDLKMWLPYVNDKASATPTYWIVRTIANGNISNKNECLQNGAVNGVVTTNATSYTSGAPIFNTKTATLDYQVASPHYDDNGAVNIGSYNLQINSKVARCLYGFTNAPISATVSVVSDNGVNQVVTSVLKESDNWIYLSANGFSYSNPTIKVKFFQEKPVVQASSKAPTKTITINCVKGKLVKKVTGTNPKCPSGYVKK